MPRRLRRCPCRRRQRRSSRFAPISHFGVRERRAPAYRHSGGALDEVVGVGGGAHGLRRVMCAFVHEELSLPSRPGRCTMQALHWRGPGSSWRSLPGLSAFFEASRPLWTCLLGGLFDDRRGTGVEVLRVEACGPPPSLSMLVDSYQTLNDCAATWPQVD